MTQFFDGLETRSEAARAAALSVQLPAAVARAQLSVAYHDLLHDVHAHGVADLEVLSHLPVTRKSELIRLQALAPPLGGFNVTPMRGQYLKRPAISVQTVSRGCADSVADQPT